MALEDNNKENIVSTKKPEPKKMKLSLSLDFRLLAGLLLVVIAVMLFLWKPWNPQPKAADRTITVNGVSTISAAPDEYVFYPIYEFDAADKATALSEMGKLDDTIVAKLKSLGVPESKIKLDSGGYDNGAALPTKNAAGASGTDGTTTYTLSLNIKIGDKDLAQKVQDYLVTTNPTGGVTPSSDFSDAKTKQLQSQARDKAAQDAHSNAEQTAKNLGVKLNGVKSINDGAGFGGGCVSICPLAATSDLKAQAGSSSPSLTIESGEDQLSYTVSVVYYIH